MRGGAGGLGLVSETSLHVLRIYFRSTVKMIPLKANFGHVFAWSGCQIACLSSTKTMLFKSFLHIHNR